MESVDTSMIAEAETLRERVFTTLIRLSRTAALPVLPSAAIAALAIARDPHADVDRLCHIVQTDIGITARVIRVASSVGFSRGSAARTVKEAITRVGLRKTCDILVLASARQMFDTQSPEMGALWNHAVAVAVAAEALAAYTRCVDPGRAFLPALFHDVGRIAFLMTGPTALRVIDEVAGTGDRATIDIEREWFGFDHAEAGAILTREWGLAPEQCEAIRWHHEPSRAEAGSELAALINAADALAYGMGCGTSTQPPPDVGIAALGLSAEDEVACAERVREAWERQRELLA
jgi:HD-like signal output (HDOD) protein